MTPETHHFLLIFFSLLEENLTLIFAKEIIKKLENYVLILIKRQNSWTKHAAAAVVLNVDGHFALLLTVIEYHCRHCHTFPPLC